MKNTKTKLLIGVMIGALFLSTLSISSSFMLASVTSTDGDTANLVAYTEGTVRPVVIVPGTAGNKLYANQNSWNTDSEGLVWPELEFPWGFDDDDLAYNLTQRYANPRKPSATNLVPSCVNEYYPNGKKKCDVDEVYVKDTNYGLDEVTMLVDLGILYQEDYLGDMVDAFRSQGYVPGQTLFAVPYDFRLAWEVQNDKLAAKIDQALAASDADKVYLVGHSQGGKLIESLLLDMPEYQDKVAGVVTYGAPFSGAAKAIRASMSEIGYDLDIDLLGFGIENGTGYLISKYAPSIFQMSSSLAYENDIRNVYGRKSAVHHLEFWSNDLYSDVASISNASEARAYAQSWQDNDFLENYGNTTNDQWDTMAYNVPLFNVVSSGVSNEIGYVMLE